MKTRVKCPADVSKLQAVHSESPPGDLKLYSRVRCRELEGAKQATVAAQAAAAAAASQLEEQRAAADERQRRFHMLNAGFKRKEDGLKEQLAAAKAAAAEARDAADAAAKRLQLAQQVCSSSSHSVNVVCAVVCPR